MSDVIDINAPDEQVIDDSGAGIEPFIAAPKEYKCLEFDNPIEFLLFFHPALSAGYQELYKWQIWMLQFTASDEWTKSNKLEAYFVAANGSGKDCYIIAGLSLYFICCTVRHRVVITTNDSKQMIGQTYPHIKEFAEAINTKLKQLNPGLEEDFINYKYGYVSCPDAGSDIVMFVTDEASRVEGYHPANDHPKAQLSLFINEGKSIKKEIYQAFYRCTGYCRYIVVSSMGNDSGYFYEQTQKAVAYPAPYERGRTYARFITAYDCPAHFTAEEIARAKNDLEPWLFDSIYMSKATSIGGNTVIPRYSLVRTDQDNYDRKDVTFEGGLDLALGGDECVLVIRRGPFEFYSQEWLIGNTIVLEEAIKQALDSLNLPPETRINVDVGGLGKPIYQHLVAQIRLTFVPISNQTKAVSKLYRNSIAEDYFHYRALLLRKLIPPPTDTKCIEQLVARRFIPGVAIMLEEKRDAKARGEKSPDRADARILAYRRYKFSELNKLSTKKVPEAARQGFDLTSQEGRDAFLVAQKLSLKERRKVNLTRRSLHDLIRYTERN